MKTNPGKILAVAGLVAAITFQCSKSGGGNQPENGDDSTGVKPPKTVRQIVLADQSVNRDRKSVV